MEQLLRAAVDSGAQSLLIKAGDVFRARVRGELIKLSETPFTAEDTRRIARGLLAERDREDIDQITDYDFGYDLEGVARFRVNILRQHDTLMIVMRVIPWEIPTFESLNLPPVLEEVADEEHGLVLVTGATGSGKTTTQSAMVGWINRNRKRHIITLEDPIEYRHQNRHSTVTQREIGADTESFRTGIHTALRHDPDVILIGEMRDADTIQIALEASETGQLVISTFHAPTAVAAIDHFLSMFNENEELVRHRVAGAIRTVISQRLLPTKEGEGRVPVVEILRFTPAVQDLVQNRASKTKFHKLMEEGRQQYGMRTFDQHLTELVQTDTIEYELAKRVATSPGDFELAMKTLAGEGDGEGPDGVNVMGGERLL